MDKRKLGAILRHVHRHFGFLFESGYEVRRAEYSPQINGSWVVELVSTALAVYITNDRGYIILELSRPDETDVRQRTSLAVLIHLLTGGQTVIAPFRGNLAWGERKQLQRLSKILLEHLDTITAHFSRG
jgi:hypothetical protein